MRTIFITPILWKRFDRASLRRGEEGQALVLIAFVVVAIVAMVGLAIDGGLGYLDSTRLQRAADAASLAGVQWIPNNRAVADGRAQLAAEALGVKVACYYDNAQAANSAYNQRCKRSSDAEMRANPPDARYTFDSDAPPGINIQYSVKLCKMENRVFLGVIGFPIYPICRTSIAAYSSLVRFGSSFNYFGTLGVLYDHYMRCDLANKADCGGTGSNLSMYGATYQRYVLMRCEQSPPPDPTKTPCVGGFWGHIAGKSLNHSNGDAYTPIKDGASSKSGGTGPLGGVKIGSGGVGASCLEYSDPTTWFVNQIYTDPANGTACNPKDASNFPTQNFDRHPDSPGQAAGFGYEIGINVDPLAVWTYSDTVANPTNHTNVNITIFDGAESDLGSGESFSTADNYQDAGTLYSKAPYDSFTFQNQLAPTSTWQTKQLICSPGTTAFTCNPAAQTPGPYPTSSRITTTTGFNALSQLFPDTNNLELTYSDIRTRFTLYGPPSVPSIPSTFGNVSGNYIAQFEMGDMSVRQTTSAPVQQPVESGSDYRKYCYIIFDDVKAYWNNTRNTGSLPNPYSNAANNYPPTRTYITQTTGTGPDYAYLWNNTNKEPNYGTPVQQSNRYAYVCPANGTNPTDYRWNQLKGTPTARYGFVSTAVPASGPQTIQKGILDAAGSQITVAPNDIAANPIVSGTIGGNFGTTTTSVDPSTQGVSSIWSAPTTTYQQTVDPAQDCRRSAIDADGWPIDSLWGHNRIPYNMAYGDPLVNRAWITGTTNIANPVAQKKIAGYYTIYYSFHGWRCDWDFDGNYTFNQKQDPSNPNSPSLSIQERTLGAQDQWDKAFTLGHPGLSSNAHLTTVLQNAGASAAAIGRETVPFGSSGMDTDYGLEPYFHLTNLAWVGGNIGPATGFTNENAPVRPGTYMLHVQTFGGSGANRYSVKAEYENPKAISYSLSGQNVTVQPVPNVFAITAMALYTNARNNGLSQQNVIFDLAYIPPANAGTQAILELWDAGDVGGTGTLGIQILKPSRFGPKIQTNGSNNPANWVVPIGAPITTRLTVCPYSLSVDSLGLNANCFTDSFANQNTTQQAYNNGQFYNDQWMLLSFTLPNAGEYNDMQRDCATNGVPQELCYYFQINYQLTGGTMTANDTTTWQLVVQGQPVHLVQ